MIQRHTLELPLDLSPGEAKRLEEMAMYLSPLVQEAVVSDGRLALTVAGPRTDEPDFARQVARLIEPFARTRGRTDEQVRREHVGRGTFEGDAIELLTTMECYRAPSPGLAMLAGPAADLLTRIDADVCAIADRHGAVRHSYGSLLPAPAAAASGYVRGFPNHVMFAAVAHRRLDALDQLAGLDGGTGFDEAKRALRLGFWLPPTVCHHTFQFMSGRPAPVSRVVTARTTCHRYEPNAGGLERLHAFQMREIVFFGGAADVEDTRQALITAFQALLERYGLTFRLVVATDPFFVSGAEQKAIFQIMAASKIEIQALIPATGKWLSVMSFNNHHETLTHKYGIGAGDLCSGCFGVGLERLVYAIVAQFGPSFAAAASS